MCIRDSYIDPENPPADLVIVTYRTAGQRGKHRKAWLYPSADPATILSAIHGEPITLIGDPKHKAAPALPAPGNLLTAFPDGFVPAPEPIVAPDPPEPHHEPDPEPIAQPAPAVAPTAPPIGEVAMTKKPGNIEYWLGCGFDPDWERTEPARSVTWRATLTDGKTYILRIPECPDQAEAQRIAQNMIPSTHHVALPRNWAV